MKLQKKLIKRHLPIIYLTSKAKRKKIIPKAELARANVKLVFICSCLFHVRSCNEIANTVINGLGLTSDCPAPGANR